MSVEQTTPTLLSNACRNNQMESPTSQLTPVSPTQFYLNFLFTWRSNDPSLSRALEHGQVQRRMSKKTNCGTRRRGKRSPQHSDIDSTRQLLIFVGQESLYSIPCIHAQGVFVLISLPPRSIHPIARLSPISISHTSIWRQSNVTNAGIYHYRGI